MSTREVSKRGRPLAFLAMLGIAWIGLRLAVLAAWPEVESAAPAQTDSQVLIALQSEEQARLPVTSSDPVEAQPTQPALPPQEPVALEAPPPAHLENGFDPLPAAAAHNVLWMDASGSFEPASPSPGAALGEPRSEGEF